MNILKDIYVYDVDASDVNIFCSCINFSVVIKLVIIPVNYLWELYQLDIVATLNVV